MKGGEEGKSRPHSLLILERQERLHIVPEHSASGTTYITKPGQGSWNCAAHSDTENFLFASFVFALFCRVPAFSML